jgi:Fe(3+) dicitrate transport protein
VRAAALSSLLLGCPAIALGEPGAPAQPVEAGEPRALHGAPPPDDSEGAPARDSVTIRGARVGFNRETRYAHSLPELDGATITVTKKTSVVRLDEQPTTIDNNQRELFDRLPGIVLAEQQNPTQLNLAYRGLGNPQESEYVLVMQDGIPLELDWIGFPTLYYLPVPQTVDEIQMIRAGSGLLYGPEPQPVINFVSRSPAPGRAAAGTSEQVGGTQALFSSFNTVSGTTRDFDYLADFSRRQSDGQRVNGDYALNAGDLHVGYRPDPRQKISLDVHAYSLGSGLAGLMSAAQYQANRDQTTTPDDRLWTDRYTAVLAYENRFRERDLYSLKIWAGYQDLVTRTDAYAPGGTAASATLGGQRFHYTGLDGRWLHGFGRGNALTLGYTLYYSVSPFHELASGNPLIGRDDTSGTPLYVDERRSRYGALFAESLFRLRRFHLVISGRFDHEELSTRETLAPHPQLADRTYRKSVPLFGVGVGNDFGRGNETYLNVSQGFRPLRYLDIASPFSNFAVANNPDPTRYLTYEAGVHGWPRPGLYYDVSLFQVDVRNRIESQQLTPTETIDVNTGNTRSRGAELEGSYDVLRSWPQISSARHLSVFANASLLDARFTASSVPGRAGSTPAYAPGYVLKAGVTWRQDGRCRISLVADSVASQYFQDSDLGVGGTPARIPAYTVIDLAGDYIVLKHLRALGGISNLADRHYYSRVFLFGGRLEPGRERAFYGGLAYDF